MTTSPTSWRRPWREANVQQERVTFYTKKPSPLRVVAGSRAFTLGLLTNAIERGLLEQLAEEDRRDGELTTQHSAYFSPTAEQAARDAEGEDDFDPAAVDQYYDPAEAFDGLGSTWSDPAVRRAVSETIAESEAGR
jgi:hypothetical protein